MAKTKKKENQETYLMKKYLKKGNLKSQKCLCKHKNLKLFLTLL